MQKNYLRYFISVVCVIFLSVGSSTTNAQINNYVLSTVGAPALDDMNTGTSLLIFSGMDDAASTVQNIGFSFSFNGISYSQFSVNSNGLMKLGSSVVSSSAINLLTGGTDFPKICPYWDDLSTGTSGIIHFKTTGVAPSRKLIVEWNVTVPKNTGGAANAKCQVWLFETSGIVQFVYGSGFVANSLNGGYTVGLSTSASDFFCINTSTSTKSITEINNNTVAIPSTRTYKFTPPVPTSPPNCATSLFPANGATGLAPDFNNINWANGGGSPSGYDVYFGTNAASLPLVSSNQSGLSYTPGVLSWNTTYYYKIVPRNVVGPAVGCSTIQFQTGTLLNFAVSRLTGISFSSISGTGSSVTSWKNSTNTDDNLSDIIPIGFGFGYQGASFSNVLISTNGFITFNTSTSATGGGSGSPYNYTNANLSAVGASASPSILAPFYEDLVCQGNPNTAASLSTSIRYLTTGVAGSRVFTVEWIGMETYQNFGPNLNFQIKLYEGTNTIEFVYGAMEGYNGTTVYDYSYSCGMNAMYISPVLQPGELFCLQTVNSENFGGTASNSLNVVPECNSMVRFSSGSYVPVSVNTAPPVNDEINSAISIPSYASPCTEMCGNIYSTIYATPSGQTSCSSTLADDDVWFSFTATNSNTTIKVIGSFGFDPVIQLYTAGQSLLSCTNLTGSGAIETLSTTSLTAGSTYFIRIYHSGSGSGSTGGQFSICVSATPLPPSNDECSGAIILPVKENCTPVQGTQTVGASASSGIPSCSVAGTNPDDDVWYKFLATNKDITITVQSGSLFNAVVQLFSGTCGNLSPISCQNSTNTGQAEVINATGLTIGQTYYLRVYHFAVGGGSGNFSICLTSPKPVCPNVFSPVMGTSNVPNTGINLRWNQVPNANGYTVYLDTISPPVHSIGNVVDTTILSGNMKLGYTYYWRVQPFNATGANSVCNTLVFATEPFAYALNVKVFIEGFYTGNRHMAASIDPVSMDTIADTLTVSLAAVNAPHSILYTTKALLSTSGLAPAYFPQPALQQSYYIVLNHRNSIETWSATSFAFNLPDTTYDFTNSNAKSFGNNMILVEPGVYAIQSGDVNQDDIIESTDYSEVENDASQFLFGYFSTDLTGDGLVESADYSIVENKVSLFLFAITP
ncbi:MAG: hypothetical protein U0073_02120 [Bacteroidia bacterium]